MLHFECGSCLGALLSRRTAVHSGLGTLASSGTVVRFWDWGALVNHLRTAVHFEDGVCLRIVNDIAIMAIPYDDVRKSVTQPVPIL